MGFWELGFWGFGDVGMWGYESFQSKEIVRREKEVKLEKE